MKYEADVDALVVGMEPGDGTKYWFIVWQHKPGTLYCAATGDGAHFDGYEYHVEEVRRIVEEESGLPGRIGHDAEGTYRAWAEKVIATQGWIGYAAGHSNCNPWTAVAALLAMWYAAKRFGLVPATAGPPPASRGA